MERTAEESGNSMQRIGLSVLYPVRHLMVALFMHWVAEQMSVSVLVDITMKSLCPGSNYCSEVIYLTGTQQTVVGIGKIITLPLIGQLSDEYGRKPLILLTLSASIVPFVLLSFNDTKPLVYAYYVARTISNMLSQGSIFSISMAYAADLVRGSKRAMAFGYITGLFSCAHLVGNLVARLLPEKYIFQVATVLLVISTVYAKAFLVESKCVVPDQDQRRSLLLQSESIIMHRWNSTKETITIISRSGILRQIILVSFFYELGMSGIDSVLLYYLKAAFGFDKNQFAEILLVVGAGSILSQLLLLPIINHFFGEQNVICMALGASIAYGIFTGIAWAKWVPYFAASFGVIYVLVKPCTYAIVSKAASADDQGKSQGFLAGVQSLASLISPLVMSPLTALFLSTKAPFHCKGFSLLCATTFLGIALFQAYLVKPISPETGNDKEDGYIQVQAQTQ